MNGDATATMEERLKKLEGDTGESTHASKKPKDKLVVESLGKVLEQALNSGDTQLLESVLQSGTQQVVSNTVQHLPSAFVVPLINIIVRRVQQTPGRALQMMVWISAIVERHAAFIISVPAAAESLQAFYTLLESRVATFSSFLALNGRLTLLVTQADKRRNQRSGLATAADLPLVTESDSEEDEDEDDDDEDEGIIEDLDGAQEEEESDGDSDNDAMQDEEDEEDSHNASAAGDEDSDDAMEEEEED
eukprot:TRINITY_DN2506_c0_g1_i1.p1 TRINITY_DN2506_c0_g1~~TRINITY_DN2506_c0_g1_i1.p1  ORF type:complete len:248 (+),score=88.31 TRINITY_DN2506_c0_g1_i1:631-1374(+)